MLTKPQNQTEPATVLLVDDSAIACEAVRDTLEEAGLRVVTMESPFGFIKTVRELAPSLILVDVGLGSVSGTKLVQLGRQHAPSSTAILLYSSKEDALLAEDMRESGADGFITKRTTGRALVFAVQAFLPRQRR